MTDTLIFLLNNLMVIADNNIYNNVQSTISSNKAAESQLAYSNIFEIVLNYNLNIDNIKSIVNEVALTKLTISNNDPRAVQMKNQINILNDILPENIRFTQVQLNYYYPTLENITYIHFKLLTLNDTYESKYFGRWGYVANEIENSTSDTVFLRFFGGDYLFPSKYSSIMDGNDMILSSNACHFNAIGIGNHEFDAGQDILKQAALMSNSPLICSNISKENCDTLNLYYNKIIMQDNIQIGVISFLTLETPFITDNTTIGIDFYDINTMFNNQQSFLELNNMNILIFHDNIQNIIDYLNLHPERKYLVDAIICGHEHIIYADYIKRDGYNIPVVEAGFDAAGIGIIDIQYNLTTKKPDNSFVEVKLIAPNTPILPEVTTLNNWINKISDPYFKEIIGNVINYDLDGLRSNVRNQETNLADLIADSILYSSYDLAFATKPENIFAFVNGGSIRNDSIIPIGTQISTETVYTISPFANTIVALSVVGRTNANKLINYIAEISFSRKGTGSWAQISKNLVFNFVTKTYSLTGGSDSETDIFYLMLTNYLANGNDGYTELKNYNRLDIGIPNQNAIINYIKYLNNVSYTTDYTRIILS